MSYGWFTWIAQATVWLAPWSFFYMHHHIKSKLLNILPLVMVDFSCDLPSDTLNLKHEIEAGSKRFNDRRVHPKGHKRLEKASQLSHLQSQGPSTQSRLVLTQPYLKHGKFGWPCTVEMTRIDPRTYVYWSRRSSKTTKQTRQSYRFK